MSDEAHEVTITVSAERWAFISSLADALDYAPGDMIESIVETEIDCLAAATHVNLCAGEPTCMLSGAERDEAQEAGCVWCTRVTIHEDGTASVSEPGHA